MLLVKWDHLWVKYVLRLFSYNLKSKTSIHTANALDSCWASHFNPAHPVSLCRFIHGTHISMGIRETKKKARQPQKLGWEEKGRAGEDKLTATTWRGSHWPPRRWRAPQRWAWSTTLLLAISLQMSGRNIRSREIEEEEEKTSTQFKTHN